MVPEELFNYVYSLSDKQIEKKYKFLGQGISRKVYALDKDYVIKIAKGEEGIYQNKVENYVFTHADENLKQFLCPIETFKPDLLIMKRAIPLRKFIKSKNIDLRTIRPERGAYEILNTLSSKYLLYWNDIISTSSWGQTNNQNVLIDYGCTSYIGDYYYHGIFLIEKMNIFKF